MSTDLQVGDVVRIPAPGGPVDAVVDAVVPVPGARVTLIRRPDGSRQVYAMRDDKVTIDLRVIAHWVRDGRPIHEPVNAVQQWLAGAVLAITDKGL